MSSNRVVWLGKDDPPAGFPPVTEALIEPNGLLAAGGDLGEQRLLYAYRNGIFPWYEEGQPILWWSPDPRCVFLPGDFHIARRLRREIRRTTIELRFNTAFGEVIRACAGPRRSQQSTWITAEMLAAFENLHRAGWAHSIEVWDAGELCGGLYGLAIGKVFFGESMFSHRANASKIALAWFSQQLQTGVFELLDCQVESPHLMSLGATLVPRRRFAAELRVACRDAKPFAKWPLERIKARDLAP